MLLFVRCVNEESSSFVIKTETSAKTNPVQEVNKNRFSQNHCRHRRFFPPSQTFPAFPTCEDGDTKWWKWVNVRHHCGCVISCWRWTRVCGSAHMSTSCQTWSDSRVGSHCGIASLPVFCCVICSSSLFWAQFPAAPPSHFPLCYSNTNGTYFSSDDQSDFQYPI